jgi:8-oxo-dGTP diphosphatase
MLPAGYVEYGEDALETAVREAMEETSLTVEVTGIRGLYFGAGDPRGSSHLAVFSARRHEGTPTAGDDAADVRWFGPNEVPDRIAFDSHRRALGQWLKGHGQPARGPSLLDFSGSGPAAPLLVYAVIENPKGTTKRLKYDETRNAFEPTGEVFAAPLPFHYGWIPRTLSPGDDRELDVIVVGEGETAIGSVVAARPIGALLRGDLDHKILAVRVDLPSAFATVTEVSRQPELQKTLEELFRSRAELTGWASAGETRRLIMEAQRSWVERHRTDR